MFCQYEINLQIKIAPNALSDPQSFFHKYVQTLLLKYSYKLEGIPLCYDIKGVSSLGDIHGDCPYIFCVGIIELLVYKIKIGDTVFVEDNMILGNFECDVNGQVEIEDIKEKKGVIKFIGKEVNT
ncbi:hypothetical protein BDAP_001043 [Binucleata daphniae]